MSYSFIFFLLKILLKVLTSIIMKMLKAFSRKEAYNMKELFKRAYSEYRNARSELRKATRTGDRSGIRYWYPRYKEATENLIAMGFKF